MDLRLPHSLGAEYVSASQRARIVTEAWFATNIFCPNCESNSLTRFHNNNPAADFYCGQCTAEFELKSGKGSFGRKVVDGSHKTMKEKLYSNRIPSFCFLAYSPMHVVTEFFIVPGSLLTYEMIEMRKPLNNTARRAGWIGCNILLERMPSIAKVFYVRDGHSLLGSDIRTNWRKALSLQHERINMKGWLLQVMRCIERIPTDLFQIDDVYAYEDELKEIYPQNNNIRAKIRQQLQLLRDRGLLEFYGDGRYKRLK